VAWNRADGNKSQSWSLTAVGDWTSFTETGAGAGIGASPTSETRTHGPTHTLTAINAQAVTSDSRGNLTQPGDGRTFSYDLDRMLSSVTVGGRVGIL
jgi:hypothetical protein